MRFNVNEFENSTYKDLVSVLCDGCDNTFGMKYSCLKYRLTHKQNSKCFCSAECKSQYRTRLRVSVNCIECGDIFPRPISGSYSSQQYCSKSCAATANNKNRPKKEKEIRTPRNFTRYELICNECNEPFFVINCQKNLRKFCSQRCAGKNNYHPDSTKATRCFYNDVQLDSGAELVFAQLLDKHQIKWIKNQYKFFTFKDKENKERKYFPDFYLPDYDQWVEIKGKRYVRDDDPLRLAAVGNIELIMSGNIRLPKCVI
jgi:hypothetical protein